MFKVGDYVMINKNEYRTSYYREELNEVFFKVGRIIEIIRPKNSTGVWYRLDITQKYKFYFAFTERYLIDLKKGI